MTGIPAHNVPAFDAAAKTLWALGFAVITPPDITRSVGRRIEGIGVDGSITEAAYRELVRLDLVELMKCDVLALLPGWRRSKGAKVEYAVAAHMGLEIWTVAGLVAACCNSPRERGQPDVGPGHGFVCITTGE